MTILTTLFLLFLRLFTETNPSKDDKDPGESDESNDEGEEKKWATREQLNNFRSSVEARIDRVMEMISGTDGEEPDSQRRTLITPAHEDDELNRSESNPTIPPEAEATESVEESSETLTPKRKRAIWEKNPPMLQNDAVDQREPGADQRKKSTGS